MSKASLQEQAKELGVSITKEDGKDKTVAELTADISAKQQEDATDSVDPEIEVDAELVEAKEETEVPDESITVKAEEGKYNLSVFLEDGAIDVIAAFRNTGGKKSAALEALLDKATGSDVEEEE